MTSGQGCSYLAVSLLCMCERVIFFKFLAWQQRETTEVEKGVEHSESLMTGIGTANVIIFVSSGHSTVSVERSA